METKVCTKCEVEKPLNEFGICKTFKDGRTYDCRKCHNKSRRQWSKDNRTKSNDIVNRYHEKNPEFMLWVCAKYRSKKRGTAFTITRQDIQIPDVCPVLGIPLIKSKGKVGPNSPSLDCINPALGYVPGNIVVMSFKANTMKSNASLQEVEALVAWMRQNQA